MTQRLLIPAMTLLIAFSTFAQGPRGPRAGGGRGLDFLAGYLALTDAQKQQAQTIFNAADSAAETARGQLASARQSLQTAIKANASESELDRLSAAVGTIEGQLLAINAKASAKFYALLTAEQRAKYDELGNRSGGGGRPGSQGLSR
jgi:Spy/CpxP family protein refolding chaperone